MAGPPGPARAAAGRRPRGRPAVALPLPQRLQRGHRVGTGLLPAHEQPDGAQRQAAQRERWAHRRVDGTRVVLSMHQQHLDELPAALGLAQPRLPEPLVFHGPLALRPRLGLEQVQLGVELQRFSRRTLQPLVASHDLPPVPHLPPPPAQAHRHRGGVRAHPRLGVPSPGHHLRPGPRLPRQWPPPGGLLGPSLAEALRGTLAHPPRVLRPAAPLKIGIERLEAPHGGHRHQLRAPKPPPSPSTPPFS